MCIIGLNRMKDVLTSAEHFRIPAAVSQMSVSWTFAIANRFLKQQRKVTFPVCVADKVTPFIRGGQDVFRLCFSFFCQTNSVLLVTYLPPSRSCVMRDNIRKVDQCFLTIICIQIAFVHQVNQASSVCPEWCHKGHWFVLRTGVYSTLWLIAAVVLSSFKTCRRSNKAISCSRRL